MLSRFFSKNGTLIFKFSIEQSRHLFVCKANDYCYKIASIDDTKKIVCFYKKLDRVEFNTNKSIEFEMKNGASFHYLEINGTIVAGMWIHKGLVCISAPSFYAFQCKPNKGVLFDNDTVYSSHNAVAKDYLGKHLYTNLLQCVFDYLYSSGIKYYVICTGFDNYRIINSSQKYGGKLIGIIKTQRFLLFKHKKIYYLNSKEKNWH